MTRFAPICLAALTCVTLSSCGSDADLCLPKGETGTVLRTGDAEGYRYVTIRRANGEEVSCTSNNLPLMQPGDQVDGWTLRRADATSPR